MIITYIHFHRTDKFSQGKSIILSVSRNNSVFFSVLSGCGFESFAVIKTSDIALVSSKNYLTFIKM